MKKQRLILIINSEVDDTQMYKNKFEELKENINDCLPIAGVVKNIDYRLIDINKKPEEAENLNIKSTPTIMVGNLKILGMGDLLTIVNIIREHVG